MERPRHKAGNPYSFLKENQSRLDMNEASIFPTDGTKWLGTKGVCTTQYTHGVRPCG